jgi:hypothetical protein
MHAYYHSSTERKETAKARSRAFYRDHVDNDPVWKKRRREHDRKRPVDRKPIPESSTVKVRARYILANAVTAGLVIKPGRCSQCQVTPGKRGLHGHHIDYSKPLEVQWLCSTCHGKAHRKEVNREL